MTNNDLLRRVRYVFDFSNPVMIGIFREGGCEISQVELLAFLKKEEEDGYVEVDNQLLGQFLDGLIITKRGRQPERPDEVNRDAEELTNNLILKKLRIALNLKEEDMIAIMGLAAVRISKGELSALFRSKGHKNYKPCGDQFLRNFLQGLTVKYRQPAV